MESAINGDEQDGVLLAKRVTGTMPARAKHSASLSSATSTGPSLLSTVSIMAFARASPSWIGSGR